VKKYKINFSKGRIGEARERLSLAFQHRTGDCIPFFFNMMAKPREVFNYKDLAIDHEKALQLQVERWNLQFKLFPDCDVVPNFNMGDTGQGVIPSMFGAENISNDYGPPFTEGRIIKNLEEDLPRLPKKIDPFHDGWGPLCLERLKFFLEATDGEVPCMYLDHQSPFGLAAKLIDGTQLMMEMYDHPDLVKELFKIVTDAMIDTIKAQREVACSPELLIGSGWQPDFYNHLTIWDDFVSVIKPEQYEEFCKEPNERLFREFGSGHLHTCGPVFPESILEVMMKTEGCDSIDLTALRGETRTKEDTLKLKEIIRGKCVCIGSLAEIHETTPDTEVLAKARGQIDLAYLKRMNEQGGFIWVEQLDSVEEGKKFLKMAENACR